MRIRDGYLVIGRFAGAPIRVHWSMPIGAFILCGFAFAPGAWFGFLLLVLVHELGHALFARAFGCQIFSIDAHAMGGHCEIAGDHLTSKQCAVIAWGGVLAQLAVLLTSPIWSRLLPSWDVARQFTSTRTSTAEAACVCPSLQ